MITKIKEYILGLDFVKQYATEQVKADRDVLYRKAFDDAQADLKETRVDDIEDRATELAAQKLAKLLGAVDEKTIVTQNKVKGLIFIGGKLVDEGRVLSLQAEANYYGQSELWNIINETIKVQAQKVMFEKSESFADMQNGKAWLYLLDLQNTILNIFKDYKPKPKAPLPPKV